MNNTVNRTTSRQVVVSSGRRVSPGRRLLPGLAMAVALLAISLVAVTPADAAAKTDINRAGIEQLSELPGVGPAKARAIVEAREDSPFSSVDDLARVSGIGPATVESLREYVMVAPPGKKK